MQDIVKVLYVEDNDFDSFFCKERLKRSTQGVFDVHLTENLAKTKEALKDGMPFDIILLDLNLPDSEGLDTLISVQEICRDIPIVVLSGISNEQSVKDAISMGAKSYLIKTNTDYDIATHLLKVVGIDKPKMYRHPLSTDM